MRWTSDNLRAYEARRSTRALVSVESRSEPDDPANRESERELHRLIENDLLRRQSEGEPIWWVHSRMDKRTTQRRGVADFVVCHDGQFVAMECKIGRAPLRPEQLEQGRQIVAAGGRFAVVRSFDDYRNLIPLTKP